MNKTYIIAEIGINHNGDINTAKKLIDLARAAGCDAVKFQKRNPDVAVPEDQKSIMRDTPWGSMTYLDYKKKIEFGLQEFADISLYCNGKIDWSASVWDLDSLEFMSHYQIPWLKIPSAKLNDKELIIATAKKCKEKNIKLIISCGMSTWQEIYYAKAWACDHSNGELDEKDLVIMYCKSTYPTPIEELNLSCIKELKGRFPKVSIGYSGHEFNIGTTAASLYLGAEYLEKHITLDRTMWGTDQMASVEPIGLFKLVQGVRELEKAYGDGQLKVTDGEIPIRKKLRGN